MSETQPFDFNVPVLTEVVPNAGPRTDEINALLAELQTKLASRTYKLADDLLRSALAEMEATLFEQISSKLRRELPELIDATLREHFDARDL